MIDVSAIHDEGNSCSEVKLVVSEALGGSDMNIAVQEMLAEWIEKTYGRNCRDADGRIDLYDKEYNDGWGDNADMIVAALLPIVIGIYDFQYRGHGTAWLRQKTLLIDRYMAQGQDDEAHFCMTNTTCIGPDWREWDRDWAVRTWAGTCWERLFPKIPKS